MGLIILSDADQEFLNRFQRVLVNKPGVETMLVSSPQAAAEAALEHDAYVVVYGPSAKKEVSFAAAEKVVALAGSRTASLLISHTVDAQLMREAMRSGFRDAVAIEGATYGDLAAAALDAHESISSARVAAGGVGGAAMCKVVTVFSTKGGVGKSVLASNLAAHIASKMGKSVVLIDLDLEFGDDAVMLGLEPTRTIYDAVQAYDRLDAQLLAGFMQTHKSGARVLLAPTRPEQAESITAARVSGIIELARELGDIVLIDTPGRLDETVLTAIDRSDQVLAIATMDLPSIKNTKVSLQKLRQLGYQNGLVSLVLNRADSKVFLEPEDVERTVGSKVVARVPSDRLVPRSVNRGIPIALEQPKSAVAKSIAEIAGLVVGEEGGD